MIKVKMNLDKINGCERRKKLIEVSEQIELIVNSGDFKSAIFDMRPWGELSKWKDVTKSELYNHIMSGKEETSNFADNEMDLYIDDYYTMAGVYGYMSPGKRTIHLNVKFLDFLSYRKLGSLIVHEWSHTMGFRHEGGSTVARSRSIPYLLNEIYNDIHAHSIRSTTELQKVYIGRSWYGRKRYKWTRV